MSVQTQEYASRRLEAFLQEVAELSTSEFPYADSKAALDGIRNYFTQRLEWLADLEEGSDPDTVTVVCTEVLGDIFNEYVPFLVESADGSL